MYFQVRCTLCTMNELMSCIYHIRWTKLGVTIEIYDTSPPYIYIYM